MASVDDPSSTQLDATLCADAKLVSDTATPEVVTFMATSDDGVNVIPPGQSKHMPISYPANPGLAPGAVLDAPDLEPTQTARPLEACYSTW